MPRYIFDTDGGIEQAIRAEADLPDVRAAQIEAIRALGELLADDGPAFWEEEDLTMTVSDGTGLVLFRLNLSAIKAPSLMGSRPLPA